MSNLATPYVTYIKHAPNVGHDFEHVQVAMGNSFANEDAEMDFFHKFEKKTLIYSSLRQARDKFQVFLPMLM